MGFRWPAAFRQMVRIGVESLPIVFLIAGSVGMIVALQAATQLRRVGATIYVADLVGVSLTRELGPLMTAIILAGRSGSAIAAELGSMKVAEEVDAENTNSFTLKTEAPHCGVFVCRNYYILL